MSQSRLAYTTDPNQGLYPTVFKKVEQSDISYEPFKLHKTWTISSGSSADSVNPLRAVYIDPNFLPALGTTLTYNDLSNADGSLQSVTYFGINHLYYKYKTQPYNTFGPTDLNKTKKHLYEIAHVLSFPGTRVGEGIKPASFTLTADNDVGYYGAGVYGSSYYGSASSSIQLTVSSDRYGNVYDIGIDTSSIETDVKFYEGFNEYFDTTRIPWSYKNITFGNGVSTTTGLQQPVGKSAHFAGTGYFNTKLNGTYNRQTDYAISFYISASSAGSNTELIVSKASSSLSAQYPFKLELSGSKQLVYSVSGGTLSTQITSSAILTGSWHHVMCQKTGSSIEMYINGTLHASASSTLLTANNGIFTASARIDNNDDLYVGGFGTNSLNLTGDLDELRIFNKSLTTPFISSLSDRSEGGTMLQTNHVGNVFEKHGVVVFSTPDYRFDNLLTLDYTASYQSTVTRYELSAITRLDAGDFNMSLNPSLTQDDDVTYQSFASSSNFNPYITTIGLYDDAGRLLAIGKLAQPIKKRDDVDMNFLIRIDLDKNIR